MSPVAPSIPSSQMPAPFLGTPYKNEQGVFEYPFPTPPLPTPPYQPSSASSSPPSSVINSMMGARPNSPSNKFSSMLNKDGPIPPGLMGANFANRRGSR